eukprot:TRINITY_DN638_c0_g1_i2.p1 TRINITY_DN638_c0_g1~~TRINITY_DN638_c0_g1_i2.p1  ORF type:complete len:196 (+),score=49.81 TRINITY_DN638_c0_g1_i2:62-649(+)
MSKVPDFGWKFDNENIGKNLILHDNGNIVERKKLHTNNEEALTYVNYPISSDIDEPVVWKLSIKGNTNSRAFGFGIIHPGEINQKDNNIYKNFIGWGTNGSRNTLYETWVTYNLNLTQSGTHNDDEKRDLYVKYDPIKNTLSLFSYLVNEENIIEDIPEGTVYYPCAFLWGLIKVTLTSNATYPLDEQITENNNN